ncbi:peptide-methionine (S)-S-oxide reductase [Candidatus Endobugula sertula]|uniref:Peptide methionine sulfoxide reductase MsrA n=1 Tax=Candidatus Endobugula sertula TaxID=62101 RepID=A0A1D2QT23_9GAMM|nr:peptide-methionine (S)-S-oxide reductase [Candidatus Endobugula sertula]
MIWGNDVFIEKGPHAPANEALKGRAAAMPVAKRHYVLGTPLQGPYPEKCQQLILGLGCFWGAEKRFWSLPGIETTAVGYSAGYTPNPTYEEVCSGQTGHNEVVLVVYYPDTISIKELLTVFWESHNPTQGMCQGNDCGTQYRSGIYYFDEQQKSLAESTKAQYQVALKRKLVGSGAITTEILAADTFYFAENYHQQYLAKNPDGYCGLGGLGVNL